MTDVLQPEIASQYGCLDTHAIIDGDASHAHVLRELARSTNRLLEQPSPVLNLAFDASTDGSEATAGSCAGFLSSYDWRPIIPGPLMVPKKSNHRLLDFKIIANITQNKTVTMQIATAESPFDAEGNTDKPGVLECLGTGAWTVYEFEGVPASGLEVETVGIFARGSDEGTTAASGTYGTPSSGTNDFVFNTITGEFRVNSGSPAWNTHASGGATYADSGRHVLLITANANGALVAPPCSVVLVPFSYLLNFRLPSTSYPILPRGLVIQNDSASPLFSFEISTLSEYRIAGISGYSRAGA